MFLWTIYHLSLISYSVETCKHIFYLKLYSRNLGIPATNTKGNCKTMQFSTSLGKVSLKKSSISFAQTFLQLKSFFFNWENDAKCSEGRKYVFGWISSYFKCFYQIIRFRPFWTYRYAYRIIIKKLFFVFFYTE